MNCDTVSIPGPNGQLTLYLHPSSSKDIVILCHGLQTDVASSSTITTVTQFLKSHSEFGVCAFDFHGCGNSAGIASYGNYWEQVLDLNAVVLHLQQQYHIQGLIGHSMGANVALWYSLSLWGGDVNDLAVVALSPRFEMTRLVARIPPTCLKRTRECGWDVMRVVNRNGRQSAVVLTPHLLLKVASLLWPLLLIPKPDRVKVLCVHGTKDRIIPAEDVELFETTLKCQILRVEDDHWYTEMNEGLLWTIHDHISAVQVVK